MSRDRISKTHRGDTVFGEHGKRGRYEYMIRLWTDGVDDVLWVDFAIVAIVGRGALDEPLYPPLGGFDGSTTILAIDAAQELCAGFVKWDGCTQFRFVDLVHVDRRDELSMMFDAVKEARRLAAGLMAPTNLNMIASEYEQQEIAK